MQIEKQINLKIVIRNFDINHSSPSKQAVKKKN